MIPEVFPAIKMTKKKKNHPKKPQPNKKQAK